VTSSGAIRQVGEDKDSSNLLLKRSLSILPESTIQGGEEKTRSIMPLAGRYELGERLGEGASSEVFRARDTSHDRDVALKLSLTSLPPEEAARLRREFKVLASLQHPRIIRTYDYGLTEDGRAYLSLELLEGKSLDRSVSGWGPELARYALQALDALASIHSEGYVHNDIKPSNLMVAPKKSGLVVMDFGFAEPQSKLTAEVKGTLGYLAPEALKGSEVDGRADLYSLGSVLYELACGRRPFEDKSPIEEVRKSLAGTPPLPSSLDQKIPPAVNEFLLKLLARNPDERYPSAREASKALAEAVGMEADPLTASYSARPKPGRFVGREKELALLGETLTQVQETKQGALVFLAGPEGIGKTRLLLEFKFACQLRHLPVRWIHAEGDVSSLAPWVSGLKDPGKVGVVMMDDWDEWGSENRELFRSSLGDYQDLGVLWVFSSKSEAEFSVLAEEELPHHKVILKGLEPEETQGLVSSILSPFPELGRLSQWVCEQTRGNPRWIGEALRFLYDEGILSPLGSEWQVDLARLPDAWAGKEGREVYVARLNRLSPGARRLLQMASAVGPRFGVDVLESMFGEGFEESWRELRMQGWIVIAPGGSAYAFRIPAYQTMVYEDLSEEERRTLHRRLGEWFESHPAGAEVLARHFSRSGDLERGLRYSLTAGEEAETLPLVGAGRAAAHFEQALSLASSLGKTSLVRELCLRTGKLYDQRGEYEKALALYDRADALLEGNEGEEKAMVLRRKGVSLMLKGEFVKAQALLEEALKSVGDCPEKGSVFIELGYVVSRQGQNEQALTHYSRAEELLKRFGDSHKLTAVQVSIAQLLAGRDRIGEAIEILKQALNSAKDPKHRPAILSALGATYLRAGRYDEAREVLLGGMEETKSFGRVVDLAHILNCLGSIEEKQRRWPQASEYYHQVLALYRKANDRPGVSIKQSDLSWIYLKCGELQRALVLGGKSLRELKTLGDEVQFSTLQHTLGLIHTRLGNWDEAAKLFQNCYQSRKREGRMQYCVNPLSDWGSLNLDQGAFKEALKIFDEALSLAGESKQKLFILSSKKALALAGMDNLAEAEELISQTMGKAKELGDEEVLAFCERSWGQILRKKGSLPDSRKVLISSANRFRSLRDAYETARTLLEVAGVSLELGPDIPLTETARFLFEACETFERQGARRDLERARTLEHSLLTSLLQPRGEKPERKGLVEALSKVSELLETLTSEEDVFGRVLELLVTLFAAERGILFLWDPLTDDLQVAKAFPPSLEKDHATLTDARDLSKTSALSAMNREEVLFTNSALSDERFAQRQSVVLNRIQSLMCAPLKLGGEVIGAIYLDSHLGGRLFSEQDRPFLKAVASVASAAIEKAREYRELRDRAEALRVEDQAQGGLFGMLGTSHPMLALFARARQVAETDTTILIEGESGTGKELLAKAVHALSKRGNGHFVEVDCGALPETLLESELFGHKKGSFTGASEDKHGLFEEAHGSTVFLDEISSASQGVQAKLLRVLQEGEIRPIGETRPRKVDVRVICATNKNLEAEVALKRFRRDLFYRLKVFSLRVPPLRERAGDVFLLAEHFRKYYAAKMGKPVRGFRKEAVEAMLRSTWEGNVRELQYAVERAVILCQGHYLGLSDLEIPVPIAGPTLPFKDLLESQKEYYVRQALEESNRNISQAARKLGVSYQNFIGLMQRFKIKRPGTKGGRPKKL
jgi:transcriptional regulator with GAF, ATPase, and Fis domain/tRNA A-37 threonylcarbamoyl transferase component Bud32/predicted negative regulator of RcsB-dependent stress response